MKSRSPLQITRAVVFALILREMRGRFGDNRLGAFWFVFEPMAHVLVLLAIFSAIHSGALPGIEFPLFVVSGIVPFILFRNIVLKGMEAVSANRALFAYRQIKPFDTIVSRMLLEIVLVALVYALILSGLGFWGGYDVSIHFPLQWILAIITGIMLSLGLALLFCVLGEAVPEVKTFLRILFMPLYFISGVILPLWVVPNRFLEWMLWNPFLHIIDALRSAVFLNYPQTEGVSLSYAFAVSAVVLFSGMFFYRARRLKLVAL